MNREQNIAATRKALYNFAAAHKVAGAAWLGNCYLPAPPLPQLTNDDRKELDRLRQAYTAAKAA